MTPSLNGPGGIIGPVWRLAHASAATCGDAGEEEEDEEGAYYDGSEENPSSVGIPRRIAITIIIASIAIAKQKKRRSASKYVTSLFRFFLSQERFRCMVRRRMRSWVDADIGFVVEC